MKQRSGFTLLELLVTIGVLGIIVAFTFPSYKAMQDRVALSGAAEEVADAIRTTQTRALTATLAANHGVHFFSDRVELFNAANGDIETRALPGNVTLACTECVVIFDRLSGTADTASTLTLGDGSLQRTVDISVNGKVQVQ